MAAAREYFTESDWAGLFPDAQERFGNQVENYELQLNCGKRPPFPQIIGWKMQVAVETFDVFVFSGLDFGAKPKFMMDYETRKAAEESGKEADTPQKGRLPKNTLFMFT